MKLLKFNPCILSEILLQRYTPTSTGRDEHVLSDV